MRPVDTTSLSGHFYDRLLGCRPKLVKDKVQFMKTINLDYGHGSVARLFRAVFFPTLLGMIFNSLITIADGIFVGRGVGPE